MSHHLIDLNDDLKRLRDKGYNVYIYANHLVVRDIPYVTSDCTVKYDGVLVSPLDLSGEKTIQPKSHQARFSGMEPCDGNGASIYGLRPDRETLRISDALTTQFHFSNKPGRGHYLDYFEKVNTYVGLISCHAAVLDPDATPLTKRVTEPEDEDSPFNYLDSASARAEINIISAKLAVERIAIIGLGGTGSYVLDLIAKTPVKEIHLFDGDTLASHNVFRAPGAASLDQLHEHPHKVSYFQSIYSKMHKGIIVHPENVTPERVGVLAGMSFVFLCVDANSSKRAVVERLENDGISFIDTGMGLYVKDERIGGNLRTTTSTPNNRAEARGKIPFLTNDEPNEYDKNIQIADLNMLNAVLAVLKWKKMRGFYVDLKNDAYSSFSVSTNRLINEGNL